MSLSYLVGIDDGEAPMPSDVTPLAVRVRGYRRKDGVYVKSYTRRKPRRYRRRRYGALPAELQARALAVIAAENR